MISSVSTVSARPAPVGAAEAAKVEKEKAGTGNGERGMVPVQRVAAVAPEVTSAPALTEVAAPAKAAVPPPVDPKVLVERMRLAEKRMAQVTAYLSAKPGAAPLWNDPQTEAAAKQVRARIRPHRGARLELIEPQWRLQHDSASISAGYKVRSDGGAGQGRLDVQLVWREGLWLVRGVDLAPAA